MASPVVSSCTVPELTGIFDLLRVARDASIDEVLAVVDTFATSARRSGVPVGRILDAVETCLAPRPSDDRAIALEWALAASRRAIGAAGSHPQCAPTTYRTTSPAYGTPHLVPLSTANPAGPGGYTAPAISMLMQRR